MHVQQFFDPNTWTLTYVVHAGHLPEPESNGVAYLKLPFNVLYRVRALSLGRNMASTTYGETV
jgi:hypothetical protein